MEAVPADIIEEILVRLPVKSLMRFKCVCKGWCALIQSRRVIHRHYCHKSNQDRLVCGMGEYVEDRLEEDRVLLPYFGEDVYHRMIAAMGILCEVSVRGDIVLLNPATHKVKRVPKVPIMGKGLLSIGFGLDPGSGDYKIVVCEREGEFFWVYNASRDCWKRVEVVGCCSVMKKSKCVRERENCTFSNGVYYWMMVKCGEEGRELEAVIIGFDMATEKFGEIKIPDVIGNPKVVAYGDSIGLLVGLDVWVLGKQGIWSKSWTIINSMLPVCIWKDEVAVVLNCGDWCLIKLEDVSRGIGKVVRLGEINPIRWKFFIPFCYKESLVWFKGEERLVQQQDV